MRLHRSLALTFSIVSCFANQAVAQTTWYVDLHGTAPGSGTSADPYTSIQYAIAQPSTVHGDTLEVAAGTYVENVDYLQKSLRVRSASGHSATSIVAAGPGHVVEMNTPEFMGGCVLDGFTVRGSTGPAYAGIHVPKEQIFGHAHVIRCVVTGNQGHGIQLDYDGQISRTTLWGNARAGIVSSLAAAAVVSNMIEWGNGEPPVLVGLFAEANYSLFSDVTNVQGISGILVADPMLWNPWNDDFHLMPGSPCIDAGTVGAQDPDGSRLDIGAVTFDPAWTAGTTIYCTSKTNSFNCLPAIGFSGAPSASSPAPFWVDCEHVINNKSGLCFYGYAQQAIPYQGGWLCIRAPFRRTPVQSSGGSPAPANDCSGRYAIDFNARIRSGADPALVPGQEFFVQFWYRDPGDPIGFNTGRSDALRAVVGN